MSLKVSGERFLAEALADAMDRDLVDVPPREQLEQQHRFSKKFERRMKRLKVAVENGRETQTVVEQSEKPQSGAGKIVDFRKLGAVAKRYSGLVAVLVCVIGLAAVAGVMTRSLRMGKSFKDAGLSESAVEDTAAPEEAWDDAAVEESAAESADDAKGEPSPGEQPEDEQEAMVPDWQEELLLESAKADELVTWHLNTIYEDGSIGLTSDVVNPSQRPDEWECIYRTKRTRDNYSAATSWDEWYALDELHMTQAGTYRLVRQVNSYRQVLQLTLNEQ